MKERLMWIIPFAMLLVVSFLDTQHRDTARDNQTTATRTDACPSP
jgi:hypothetical protein